MGRALRGREASILKVRQTVWLWPRKKDRDLERCAGFIRQVDGAIWADALVL